MPLSRRCGGWGDGVQNETLFSCLAREKGFGWRGGHLSGPARRRGLGERSGAPREGPRRPRRAPLGPAWVSGSSMATRRRHRATRAAPARVRAPGGRGCGTDKNNNINDKEEGGGTVVGLGGTKCGTTCGEGERPLRGWPPDSQPLASPTLLTRVRGLRSRELKNPPLYLLGARKRQDLF